jgi:hypothetical protein
MGKPGFIIHSLVVDFFFDTWMDGQVADKEKVGVGHSFTCPSNILGEIGKKEEWINGNGIK